MTHNEYIKLNLGKISSADFQSTILSFSIQASKQQVLIVMTYDKLLCINHYYITEWTYIYNVNFEPQYSLIFWYSQSFVSHGGEGMNTATSSVNNIIILEMINYLQIFLSKPFWKLDLFVIRDKEEKLYPLERVVIALSTS